MRLNFVEGEDKRLNELRVLIRAEFKQKEDMMKSLVLMLI